MSYRRTRPLGSFDADARQAVQCAPGYFMRWYTLKSLAVVVAVGAAAYYVGKDRGSR